MKKNLVSFVCESSWKEIPFLGESNATVYDLKLNILLKTALQD